MMDRDLENKLIEALDALEAGESIESILRRYPENEAELRLMLLTARAAAQLRKEPSASAQARSRAAFLAEADQKLNLAAIVPPPRRFWFRLPVLQIFTVLLVVFGVGIISSWAAQQALPGSTLYGVKRGLEEIRFLMASADRRDELLTQARQERLNEINVLLANDTEADVAFIGPIEALRVDTWQIAGLTVRIEKSTTIIGGVPTIGQNAAVNGFTRDGVLFAETISVAESDSSVTPMPDKLEPPQTKDPDPSTIAPDASTTRTPSVILNPTATFLPPTQTSAPPPIEDNENDNDNNSGPGGSGGSGGHESGDDSNENSNDNDDD